MRSIVSGLAFIAVAALLAPAHAQERRVEAADRTELALTIYNNGLVLVKDRRNVTVGAGLNRLAFHGISARTIAESVLLDGGAGVTTVEQNFEFDLLTPAVLLKKSVGRKVGIVKTHPTSGKETIVEATVLSAEDGVVLQVGERIETGIPGRLVFDSLPAGLRPRPALVMLLESESAGARPMQLSYLSEGFDWHGDYVAELERGGERLDLKGWATLTNTSGSRFVDARVKLVAGEVRRVSQAVGERAVAAPLRMMAKAAAAAVPREKLAEFHLYTLPRPLTIENRQTKQVALLGARGVPVTAEFVHTAQGDVRHRGWGEPRPSHPEFRVRFENTREVGLGEPLPAGVVRVYTRDSGGDIQLIGEDFVEHTAKGGAVRLSLGRSFDVTVKRTQTRFSTHGLAKNTFETAWRIDMENARDKAVTLTLTETFAGDWEILEASVRHSRRTADRAIWEIPIEAGGSARLTYGARIRR